MCVFYCYPLLHAHVYLRVSIFFSEDIACLRQGGYDDSNVCTEGCEEPGDDRWEGALQSDNAVQGKGIVTLPKLPPAHPPVPCNVPSALALLPAPCPPSFTIGVNIMRVNIWGPCSGDCYHRFTDEHAEVRGNGFPQLMNPECGRWRCSVPPAAAHSVPGRQLPSQVCSHSRSTSPLCMVTWRRSDLCAGDAAPAHVKPGTVTSHLHTSPSPQWL